MRQGVRGEGEQGVRGREGGAGSEAGREGGRLYFKHL